MSNKRRAGASLIHSAASSLIMIGCLVFVPGCGKSDQPASDPGAQVTTAVNSEEPVTITFIGDGPPMSEGESVEQLRAAADKLWTARVEADYDTMYDFRRSAENENVTREQFIEWNIENQPFQWNSYQIGEVHVQGLYGWVQVSQNVSMRRMPGLEPRETTVWEAWVFHEDKWSPVASPSAENLPQCPVMRDYEAEKKLASRFAEAWEHRVNRDWDQLYEMTSKATQESWTKSQFAEGQDLIIFTQCRVEWVEVVDGNGRVAALFEYKFNDPSMEKMQPRVNIVIERWLLEDGQWVLHTPRQELEQGAGSS